MNRSPFSCHQFGFRKVMPRYGCSCGGGHWVPRLHAIVEFLPSSTWSMQSASIGSLFTPGPSSSILRLSVATSIGGTALPQQWPCHKLNFPLHFFY
uniref:Uncharacterized protein n=1 Tax=Arundo donax TaxID=35708 RepID=A0A0A9HRZ3_ARUDO